MVNVKGSCHCGNIQLNISLSQPTHSYHPRACDCDFCRKQGASYISDPHGTAYIRVKAMHLLGKYQQGSGAADFLFCLHCGVLIGVSYQTDEKLFAAFNSQVLDDGTAFGDKLAVSPRRLSKDEKTSRWQDVWFSNVTLTSDSVL